MLYRVTIGEYMKSAEVSVCVRACTIYTTLPIFFQSLPLATAIHAPRVCAESVMVNGQPGEQINSETFSVHYTH